MLFITTGKIKYSTVGASFTVTFSVAPDEIGYLQMLNSEYKKMNCYGFRLPTEIAEQTEPSTDCGWK